MADAARRDGIFVVVLSSGCIVESKKRSASLVQSGHLDNFAFRGSSLELFDGWQDHLRPRA